MSRFETWLVSDLKKPNGITALRGRLFTQDSMSNLIGVHVYDDGQPVENLGGTITGWAIRADGNTVVITGTADGGDAYIVLPESAYAVPGNITITIRHITGTGDDAVKTTLAVCTGIVYRTATDAMIDPGGVVPDLEDLLAQIEAMEEATEAANDAAEAANDAAEAFNSIIDDTAGAGDTAKVWSADRLAHIATDVTHVKGVAASVDGDTGAAWESGGLYDATGIEYASSSSSRTGFIPVKPGERIMVISDGTPGPVTFAVFEFAANTATASGTNERIARYSNTFSHWIYITSSSANYIRITISKGIANVGGHVYIIRDNAVQKVLDSRVDAVHGIADMCIPGMCIKAPYFNRYGINRTDGTVATSSDARVHTAFVCVKKGDIVHLPDEYKYSVYYFTVADGFVTTSYDDLGTWCSGEYVVTRDGLISIVVEKPNGAAFTSTECHALEGKCLIYTSNTQTIGGLTFEVGHIGTTTETAYWVPAGVDFQYNGWANKSLYTTRFRVQEPTPVRKGTTISIAKGWRFYIFKYVGSTMSTTQWYTGSYTFEEDTVIRLVLDQASGTSFYPSWPALSTILTVHANGERTASEYNADMDQALVWASGANTYVSGDSAAAVGKKAFFSFAAATDIHGSGDAFARFIDYANDHAGYLDAVMAFGDMVPVEPTQSIPWFADNLKRSAKPFLFTVGNHDVGQTNLSGITQDTARTNYFTDIISKGFLTAADFEGSGKCSWYKDFAAPKIRVIAPFEYGNCYETASGATNKCARRWFPTETLQWLADTLYSTPAGYCVMILLHQTSSTGMSFVSDPFTTTEATSYAHDHWNDLFMNLIDGNPLEDLVNAFITGVNFSHTYTAASWTQLSLEASVSKDFSQRSEAGKFIAYFCGHTHSSYVFRSATYPGQICIVLPTGSDNLYQRNYGDVNYSPDSRNRDNFYFVGIDTAAQKINLVKIGGQITTDMRERKYSAISYGT